MFNKLFSENRAFCEMMWKNIANPNGPENAK